MLRALLALLALTSSAFADGYLNPPPYATGVVFVQAGTAVSTILRQAYTPGDLSTFTSGPISVWTVTLPSPAFDGQVITIGCPGGDVTTLTVASSDSISGTPPTSCAAAAAAPTQLQFFHGAWTVIAAPGAVVATKQSSVITAPTGPIPATTFPYSPLGLVVASTSDNASGGTTGVSSPTNFYAQQFFGGPAINSGRNNIAAYSQFNAATSPTNPYRFYVGISSLYNVFSGDNGTSGSPQGDFEAATDQIQLAPTATNLFAEVGHEIDVSAQAGSSVYIKTALLLSEFANDAVHGSGIDAWILTYGFAGGIGMNTWAEINAQGGAPALPATGTVINLDSIPTIADGFKFNSTTITGNVLSWGAGWKLSGAGTARLGDTITNILQLSGATAVASLPLCNSANDGVVLLVADAATPVYNAPLTGGGTSQVIGLCNGTTWTAH